MRRLSLHSALLRDGAVAAVAFTATLVVIGVHPGPERGLDPLGGVLAALASFPLLGRRRAPLAVFALTTAASACLNGLGYGLGPPVGPTIALFFVASDERTRSRIRGTAAAVLALFAAHVGSTVIPTHSFPTTPILAGVVVWGAAWMLGDQLRQRRRRAVESAERTGRERRLAVAEERTRIARDLHDSAAHSINVILVQAGAARLLQQRDPEATTAALSTIEVVARETIGEIDRLVRDLREDRGNGGNGVEPPAGLAALETLVERHRAGGLEVEIHVAGRRRTLPPRLDQGAYRLLQETLTNAARHGAGRAEVEVAYGERDLELTVSNPVAPGSAPGGGHGLLGMRERAELLGGTLEAGGAGGRFRVHASLPYVAGEAS